MKPKTKTEVDRIVVIPLEWETLRLPIIGTSPLLLNRMAEKARQTLLMPPKKANRAELGSRHYRDLVTPEDAKSFWEILPN